MSPQARRRALHHRLNHRVGYPNPRVRGRVLVASWGDVPKVGHRRFIMIEHGAGQAYGPPILEGTTPDYTHTCGLDLILCPNETVANRNRLHHPHAISAVVGSAKTDYYAGLRRQGNHTPNVFSPTVDKGLSVVPGVAGGEGASLPWLAPGLPVVAFAWHWPAPGPTQEAFWAFPFWRDAIAELAAIPETERGYRLLGHGHPRAWHQLASAYKRIEVMPVQDPEQIVRQANILVFDSTSFGFEAAAVGIPVVLLDAPHYRVEVRHGLRWWDAADAGLRIGSGTAVELHEAIVKTLTDDPCASRRAEVAHDVFGPLDGRAAERAVAAIRALR